MFEVLEEILRVADAAWFAICTMFISYYVNII